jgi:SAM-dependent methyltransferase
MPAHRPWVPARGTPTATEDNVAYRIGLISRYLSGRWLDFGCADGGYVESLLASGASEVVGIDVEPDRIATARERNLTGARFMIFDGFTVPLAAGSVDGVFMNEVIEHVADESAVLSEVRRVLRPGGVLIVMSPNRWFPFEGHGIQIGSFGTGPVPFVPWLPKRLTRRFVTARNYWPSELTSLISGHGFEVDDVQFVWPVFDVYRWLPPSWIERYRRYRASLDDLSGIRRLGVSTLVVATRTAHERSSKAPLGRSPSPRSLWSGLEYCIAPDALARRCGFN